MINIFGDYFSSSGYGIHTRNLARAINKIHPVKVHAQLDPNNIRNLGDDELEMLKRTGEGDINLIITMPMFWRLYLNDKRNWVFLVFEGDKIPKSWAIECMNERIEKIFVPSEHTKEAVLETFETDFDLVPFVSNITKKLKVMSHGIDEKLFYPKENKHERYTFLCNKGWRNNEDRGGIQYAVKSYLEEFTDKDNVLLILKLNPAYGIPDINNLINELKPKDRTNFAPIQIVTDNIPYEFMVNLYNSCDVFVNPTRAEAFCIPCLESLGCGKVVISTAYGGQTDYLNDKNSFLIDYDLVKITHETLYEGISWVNIKIEDLKKKMRWCYENPEELKKMQPECLKTANTYTWGATAKKICSLIY
jgi:glycosyltransferase involved in cell wall biosynthesis